MRPTKRTRGFVLIAPPPRAAPRAGRRSPRSRSRPRTASPRRRAARAAPARRAIAADRGRELVRPARRHEQAVLAVAYDLGNAADGSRDNGHTHRQRLDRRVRQVLPGAREEPRLGAGDDPQRLVARERARGTRSGRRPPTRRERLQSAHGPARRRRGRAAPRARAAIAANAVGEILRLGQAADEDERPGRQLLRLDLPRRRRRVRQHVDPLSRRAPTARRSRPGTRSGRRSCARAAALAFRSALSSADGRELARPGTPRACREEAVAPRALVRGVGRQLRDERAAREHGRERRCAEASPRHRATSARRAARAPRSATRP